MSNNNDFILELRKDFLEEAAFLLEQCEESYLKLEQPELRTEELAKIFRLAHSMKGGGAAVGFEDLAAFAHIVEDCLALLRTHPEHVDTHIISTLLKAGDAFKIRVNMLKNGDPSVWDVSEVRANIQTIVSQLQSDLSIVSNVTANISTVPTTTENPDVFWKEMEVVTQAAVSELKEKGTHPTPTLPPETVITPVEAGTIPAAAPPPSTLPPATASKGAGSIKVDTDKIDSVLDLVGELVVCKSQLLNQVAKYPGDTTLSTVVSLMDKTIRELQDKSLGMRMTPLKGLFLKTQRLIRDLSVKLQKPIDFQMTGEETEVDRTMVELLSDPLLHIARNSLDHGIEISEIRKERGKTEKGTIHVSAQQAGGRVLVKITDDGGGLNRPRIAQKAVERGLIASLELADQMSDSDVFKFIFMPGFSTAEKVTDLSGRGVGMDVVKTNIETIKGTIEIDSTEGKGTCLTLSLPLTASITDGMVIRAAGDLYVLPIDSILELINLEGGKLVDMQNNRTVLHHRGRILPLIELDEILKGPTFDVSSKKGSMVALVASGEQTIALRVQQVVGQAQVVLKPLGNRFQQIEGVSGVAIMGDGRPALVLHPEGLVGASIWASETQGAA